MTLLRSSGLALKQIIIRPWVHADASAVLVIVLVVTVAFGGLLTASDGTVLGESTPFYGTPILIARESIVDYGTVPIWNLRTGAGEPLLANPLATQFYPLSLIAMLSANPSLHGIRLMTFAHLLGGALAIYGFARIIGARPLAAVLAPLLFVLNEQTGWRVENGFAGQIYALVWMPTAAACAVLALRRDSLLMAALSGTALAMMVLAGTVYDAYFAGIAVAVVFIVWSLRHINRQYWRATIAKISRALVLAGTALAALLGIAAVKLIPVATFQPLSTRVGFSLAEAEVGLDNIPTYAGHLGVVANQIPTHAIPGVNILVVALAGLGMLYRRFDVAPLVTMAVIGLWASLGMRAPVDLYAFFHGVLPGFAFNNTTLRFMNLFYFAFAALAPFGLVAVMGQIRRVWGGDQFMNLFYFAIRAFTRLAALVPLGLVALIGQIRRVRGGRWFMNLFSFTIRTFTRLAALVLVGIIVLIRQTLLFFLPDPKILPGWQEPNQALAPKQVTPRRGEGRGEFTNLFSFTIRTFTRLAVLASLGLVVLRRQIRRVWGGEQYRLGAVVGVVLVTLTGVAAVIPMRDRVERAVTADRLALMPGTGSAHAILAEFQELEGENAFRTFSTHVFARNSGRVTPTSSAIYGVDTVNPINSHMVPTYQLMTDFSPDTDTARRQSTLASILNARYFVYDAAYDLGAPSEDIEPIPIAGGTIYRNPAALDRAQVIPTSVLIISQDHDRDFNAAEARLLVFTPEFDPNDTAILHGRSAYVDDYGPIELSAFDVVILADWRAHNDQAATERLDGYLSGGGQLLVVDQIFRPEPNPFVRSMDLLRNVDPPRRLAERSQKDVSMMLRSLSDRARLRQVPAVSIDSYTPTEIRFRTGGNQHPFPFLFSQMYFPGWTVELDGMPTPIYMADSLINGVMLPPGQAHTLKFTFAPREFYVGAAISLTAIVVLLAGVTWTIRQDTATRKT